ncbi:MerR family transcriptional regulator [Micromonospora auratinigra]|uniref:DNA-binding transcriptional regulator, MerR family n=1 Tax=Micromonospora auratinigra TaxID=261654 RepID=A0A1A8Z210_9ACTN|nr:MerR family transcriptional regulator [Micromonospora auratinigra]SBT37797.1 DNA-binding transcriptional regulator, MerR family [Micromonospora auratinigra]
MDGETRYSIGELARRTGLTVKTIRFYADQGVVPPDCRTTTGQRRWEVGAVARLDLVRTLRELGLDLATVRRVVDREVPLGAVAGAHAEALATQIRLLRLRRAVLTVAARGDCTPEEMARVHGLARLSAQERRRLVADFLDATFAGLTADGAFDGISRSLTPELPDDPAPAQFEAWLELAVLTRDPEFRAGLRRLAEQHAADRAGHPGVRRDAVALACQQAEPALAAGVDPTAPAADPVVAAMTGGYAALCARRVDPELHRRLLDRLESAADPRRERYLHLLSVVNGWPATESRAPALDWSIRALRCRTPV